MWMYPSIYSGMTDITRVYTCLTVETTVPYSRFDQENTIPKQKKLTVDHLHDAAGAREPIGKLVAGSNHISSEGAVRHGLVCFGGSAGGVEEVPSDVVRVDAAGGVVVRCTVERMHVEATLGNHAVWVGHVVGVADEELEVALVGV